MDITHITSLLGGEVLVHGRFDQLVHAGGDSHSLVIPLVGKAGNGHVLGSFQIKAVGLFQTPEDVPFDKTRECAPILHIF